MMTTPTTSFFFARAARALLVAALALLLAAAPGARAAATSTTSNAKNAAAATSLTSTTPIVFDKELLLDSSVHEGESNRIRSVVTSGRLAAGQGTPTRLFPSPLIVCATQGCVKAVAKDGEQLGAACAGNAGMASCTSLGGRRSKAFALVADKAAGASYLELATTWPGNELFKSA
jgi:hypothetical protein